MKISFMVLLASLILMTAVLDCNMLRGVGKDVENAGGSIQRTVDHND